MGNFERIRYPDGQISVKWQREYVEPVFQHLKQRINSYEDLFFLRSVADVIDAHNWTLFIPCMFGQRSDRRFSENQSFDLHLIIDFINSCGFSKVQVLDPHSDVTMALLNNGHKLSPFEYVRAAVADIMDKSLLDYEEPIDEILLVSPDAGAYKKVFEFGEKLDLPVMGASKHRDKNGKVDLIFTHDVDDKDCLIVDDLCDGGYTFLVLADALRKHKARRVYLYVTHGLFSKGFGELHKEIDHIYCTNSVKDIHTEDALIKEAYPFLSDFLTQFKVI
jgi:ribose-phosphate pyrophosphokinase